MHLPGRPKYRIDGAGLDAQRAADALRLIDEGNMARLCDAARRIECPERTPKQRREFLDDGFAPGRAAVDVGSAGCDGLGVGSAALEAALGALGLRQQGANLFDERSVHFFSDAASPRTISPTSSGPR
jgi:hypothetical protein